MQRGIMGFEIRKFPMPEAELPIDKETVCGQDIKADLQMGDLEDMYSEALEAYIYQIDLAACCVTGTRQAQSGCKTEGGRTEAKGKAAKGTVHEAARPCSNGRGWGRQGLECGGGSLG